MPGVDGISSVATGMVDLPCAWCLWYIFYCSCYGGLALGLVLMVYLLL